jgi:hypothetical protein
VALDAATISAQPIMRTKATTDYLPAGSVDVRDLSAASHSVTVDYRTVNSLGTAKVKYVRFVGLPL